MNKLLDKLILFSICLLFYIQAMQGPYEVVPVICAIIASAACSYLEKESLLLGIFFTFCAASLAFPPFLFFLPLICYDIFTIKWRYSMFLAIIPLSTSISAFSIETCIFIILLIALSYLLSHKTAVLDKVRKDYALMRDSTKELSLSLERKNKELLEKQDYEVHLATLNERNRIARDIHDSIGHLLSSSILQAGALIATCKDEATKERLGALKDTLSTGMTSVRESVHNLHDESIDLYAGIRELVSGFDFCPISLEYDADSNPPREIKYALLAILKEALANIIRHSDATNVIVTLREHPGLYQLVIRDNGTKKEIKPGGIGIKNIQQRVQALDGHFNIGTENGFTVFVSIPKEK